MRSLLLLDHVSDFSHSGSISKLWQNRTWFLRFCNQTRFEFQFPRDWKSWTFLPRDLQLSNFMKWNFYYYWLHICKTFQVLLCWILSYSQKNDNILYQFWTFDWMKLNKYKGSFLFKSPSSSSHYNNNQWCSVVYRVLDLDTWKKSLKTRSEAECF